MRLTGAGDGLKAAGQRRLGHGQARLASGPALQGRRARRPLACRPRALQSPDNLTPPVAEADRAVQSLIESGLRGSLALVFALPLHANLLSAWSFDAADVALGLQAALPLVALDAALLLPHGTALAERAAGAATDRRTVRFAQLAGAALAAARADQARYGLAGVAGASLRTGLAAAAQLSEELLSRGVLFGFAAAWISGRLAEAGLADATLGAGPDAPLLSEAARAAVAGAIVLGAGVRYAQHAAQNVAALQEQRRAEDSSIAPAAASRREEAEQRVAAALLGGRAMLGCAAGYAAFLASGNLAASFTTGLVCQLASAAVMDVATRGDQEPPRA
ncbi:hypothetical protein Rsub_11071 [Raphidocelis subcapitata]|uniref:Uncharacterized protein n=1 Tax=Raphidocelis subcapitata TaxID=307507 RepID=A0A2V0PEG8_9CHLO|nr:hypothetical protein Rsub_11071 [Raphidocelis subcapitata]|eukprot:GBF98251.1 hypothetical protein Rsub_11071 [Raphidocelis subcapitata]